ncbi:hypothetical protein HDU76_000740 [Blyttiomyces sp. JEL0837]|nr:hypothetical protein HDU76_000740 [Blyttiomyces sp. JEL0837]
MGADEEGDAPAAAAALDSNNTGNDGTNNVVVKEDVVTDQQQHREEENAEQKGEEREPKSADVNDVEMTDAHNETQEQQQEPPSDEPGTILERQQQLPEALPLQQESLQSESLRSDQMDAAKDASVPVAVPADLASTVIAAPTTTTAITTTKGTVTESEATNTEGVGSSVATTTTFAADLLILAESSSTTIPPAPISSTAPTMTMAINTTHPTTNLIDRTSPPLSTSQMPATSAQSGSTPRTRFDGEIISDAEFNVLPDSRLVIEESTKDLVMSLAQNGSTGGGRGKSSGSNGVAAAVSSANVAIARDDRVIVQELNHQHQTPPQPLQPQQPYQQSNHHRKSERDGHDDTVEESEVRQKKKKRKRENKEASGVGHSGISNNVGVGYSGATATVNVMNPAAIGAVPSGGIAIELDASGAARWPPVDDPIADPFAVPTNTHNYANASLLALAPSTPIIRIPKHIYSSLVTSSTPPLQHPSCCPSLSQYSQYLLVGTREVFNDKLTLQIKTAIPFPSSELGFLTMLATHLNSDSQTILGFAVVSRFLHTLTSTTSSQLDSAASLIATSYFDMFHTAVLNVFARNSAVLKSEPSLSALSRFCIDTCTFLQDCVGLVCLPRNMFAGNSMMVAFDTPQLMPYDIERRLAILAPELFAAIDPSLAPAEPDTGGTKSETDPSTSASNISTPPMNPGKPVYAGPRLPPPSPHPPMPLPVPPAKVHQLPYSTLHILTSPHASFLATCLGAEAVLRPPGELDDSKIPRDLQLQSDDGSAAMPAWLRGKVVKLQSLVAEGLPRRVAVYEEAFRELEALTHIAEALGRVTPEDIARVASLGT